MGRAGATILAWNAAVTGRDGIRAVGSPGVTARNGRVTTNKAPRDDEEAGFGAATGATEWGGVGATAACNTTAVGRDTA